MKHGGDIYNNSIDLDLSVNKNPFALPEEVYTAIEKATTQIGNYPEYDHKRLKVALAELEKCNPQQIVCGNGASEIFMAIMHAIRPKKALLIGPGFYGYEYVCDAIDCEIEYFFTKEEQGFAVTEEYLDYLDNSIDMIFIGNPNNPTGRFIDEQLLNKILSKAEYLNITVVLDECFYFLGRKEKKKTQVSANIIRVRAFTKLFAIPGVRIGYAICSEEMAGKISKQLPEWNLSQYADEVGRACCDILTETDYRLYSLDLIDMAKEYLKKRLTEIGISFYPSDVNFLLIKARPDLGEKLIKKRILIRDCREYQGLGVGYFRVAVQSKEYTDRLIKAIIEIREE